jgi:hypothetical protein
MWTIAKEAWAVEEPTRHAPDPSPGSESQPAAPPSTEPAPSPESPSGSGAPIAPGLGERDLRVLAFERHWWRHAGAKEQAIREDFGLSSARYYQILGALIDSPAALAHDPMLVKRLQRVRDSRAATRADRARRMGDDLRRRTDRLD